MIKRPRIRDLIEEQRNNPDPLNLLNEIATVRALLDDALTRYQVTLDGPVADKGKDEEPVQQDARPVGPMDLSHLAVDISRIAERMERARSANAISRPELLRVMAEFARVVEAYVADPKVLDKIKAGWLAVRVA